jgi:hypothetical protein
MAWKLVEMGHLSFFVVFISFFLASRDRCYQLEADRDEQTTDPAPKTNGNQNKGKPARAFFHKLVWPWSITISSFLP